MAGNKGGHGDWEEGGGKVEMVTEAGGLGVEVEMGICGGRGGEAGSKGGHVGWGGGGRSKGGDGDWEAGVGVKVEIGTGGGAWE